MIIHVPSTLTRDTFLDRHPVSYVVVGHFDQQEPIPADDYLRDEPNRYSSLAWAVASLELSGNYAVRMLEDWSTVWLAFERSEDAQKVCDLVGALGAAAFSARSCS